MRYSTLVGRTLRDIPADAEQIAHQLVVRAGLARPLLAGGAALLPLGLAALRRIEAIMHEELARIDAQEFRTPVVQPASLWEQSGRYEEYGPQMLRFQNRAGQALIVAPTHEEAVAELVRREIESYRQLPALIYQIHTKYRDELRVRGGLLRLREFTMLDAYSFDRSDQDLDAMYARLAVAFERIFARCGLRYVAVEAATGEMGGREAREYMALSAAGEDTLAICANCGYAANLEIARSAVAPAENLRADAGPPELVATPDCATIAELAGFLGIQSSQTAKAVFFDTPERGLVFVVIRGDLEVNELKLRAAVGVSDLRPASAEQIAAVGAVAGYASPVGLEGVTVVADRSLVEAGGLVAGANQSGYHLRNVVYGRDWQASLVADLASVRAGDACVVCASALALERGIEVGHIFKLGTRFTEALGANYLTAEDGQRPIVMGSYGIGLERMLQMLVEQHHDQAGIVWPAALAPFQVHLVRLGASAGVTEAADGLYDQLARAGLRVLYDDRAESAGVKFNDADLIGLPTRVVVSDRGLKAGSAEIKQRASGEVQHVALGELADWLTRPTASEA